MLEHVTANQTRFVAPGLSADSRGIALGRFCVVLLPSIDRVVGLFRGLSERGSLDDLLASLKVLQVRTPLKSREFLVQIPVSGSHVADGIAAAAALMGGLTFTGSAKHFVKFRDSGSPLGYDVDNLYAGVGDFILYAADFVQAYEGEREVPFPRLALNLSLEPDRLSELMPEETALLRTVPGLWRVVTSYLHRNNLPCEVAACEGQRHGSQGAERFFLIRSELQPRMVNLFRTTPGIGVYQQKTERVAVQLGYRHPLELSSCSSIFQSDRYYIFSGKQDRLDIVVGGVNFFSASSLIRLGDPSKALEHRPFEAVQADGVQVPLKLVTSSGPRPPVRASRIPLSQAGWLKKLVYLLPPQALERYQICLTQDSLFLLSDVEVEFIPLGTLYYQVALGILVPVGYELLPRVHPEVLVQHMGTGQDKLVLFTPDSPAPLSLPRAAFGPLTRQALAAVEVRSVPTVPQEAPAVQTALMVNDPVGAFPLWGFDPSAKKKDQDQEA
jgi:hypothetical protein